MPNPPTIRWRRLSDSPFLGPHSATIAPDAVTTPDVLQVGNKFHLYVGVVGNGTEKIVHSPFPFEALSKEKTNQLPSSAQVVLIPGSCRFDRQHVFDPAVIFWRSRIFLYYSGIGQGEDAIGLAISSDGIQFNKRTSPVLEGRSPEIHALEDRLFLFYVKRITGQGYRIYTAQSEDGVTFDTPNRDPVVVGGAAGSWDAFEVTTPRIFERNGWFYMSYAGSRDPGRTDLPDAFGLARSRDLVTWEKYQGNPIFRLGKQGSWDDGAIWFGTVFSWKNDLYLLYEGGRMEDILDRTPAMTQVGLAKISGETFDRQVLDW